MESLALTGVTKIWRRGATALGPLSVNSGGPFDLAILDPPYKHNLVELALNALRSGEWLTADALVVAEHHIDELVPESEGFEALDTRAYGDTAIAFLRARSGLTR